MYVPAIFHHRPHGSDDAHGLGQASRYLSAEVRGHFTTTRPPGMGLAPGAADGERGGAGPGDGKGLRDGSRAALRERMSVQSLFET